MWNLLNPDSEFAQVINKIVDMILLSLAWLLLCGTVIGIGPAMVGLYYAVAKSIRRDRGSAMQAFFHAIKVNWKMSLLMGVILTVIGVSAYFFDLPNIIAYFVLDNKPNIIWVILSVFKIFLFLGISMYIFPLISRYHVTFVSGILNAFVLTFRHIGSTLAMCAIISVGIYVSQFSPILLGFLPAGIAYACSFLLEPILKQMISEEEKANIQDDDPWYLE